MIDWQQVTTLRDDVGPEDFDEIVARFLQEANETTRKLAAACDPHRLEEDLHSLKGNALNLGFSALSDLCQRGEISAAGGTLDPDDLGQILSCYDASRQSFLDWYGASGAAQTEF
ncbi:Hpt domain protein [Sulfitobacter sp. THAF37]|uniref:Hpt domain-containing protein n=1 Tax=Sulfitobacter sp. THAF37 TaxID=2587855 RepID=UPI001267B743|nr:Hpt domain-containing protein [Sulfitobacter sp. THAF37]QFT58224.1 Hpt domain protein [Sulfitobacter sp. THAF37]